MLMSNTNRPAKLHYMANGFRVLSTGDHVVCAASGVPIALDDLRYWDVAGRRPFATADLASAAMRPR